MARPAAPLSADSSPAPTTSTNTGRTRTSSQCRQEGLKDFEFPQPSGTPSSYRNFIDHSTHRNAKGAPGSIPRVWVLGVDVEFASSSRPRSFEYYKNSY